MQRDKGGCYLFTQSNLFKQGLCAGREICLPQALWSFRIWTKKVSLEVLSLNSHGVKSAKKSHVTKPGLFPPILSRTLLCTYMHCECRILGCALGWIVLLTMSLDQSARLLPSRGELSIKVCNLCIWAVGDMIFNSYLRSDESSSADEYASFMHLCLSQGQFFPYLSHINEIARRSLLFVSILDSLEQTALIDSWKLQTCPQHTPCCRGSPLYLHSNLLHSERQLITDSALSMDQEGHNVIDIGYQVPWPLGFDVPPLSV